MKKTIFILLLVLNILIAKGQEEMLNVRYSAKSGFGYFSDIFGLFDKVGAQPGSGPGQPGNMLWLEYEFHLNNKNSVGFFVGSGRSNFTYYLDEPFIPSRVTVHYWQLNLNFYRNFYFEKSTFSLGAGPSYYAMKHPGVGYKIQIVEEEGSYYYNYYDLAIEMDHDAVFGLNLDLNYEYSLSENLGIGIKFNGLATMFYGVESFLLSPYLRFCF